MLRIKASKVVKYCSTVCTEISSKNTRDKSFTAILSTSFIQKGNIVITGSEIVMHAVETAIKPRFGVYESQFYYCTTITYRVFVTIDKHH